MSAAHHVHALRWGEVAPGCSGQNQEGNNLAFSFSTQATYEINPTHERHFYYSDQFYTAA